MKYEIQISEMTEGSAGTSPGSVIFSQVIDNLDIAKLVQFINTAKPKRVYRAKAKTEAAK